MTITQLQAMAEAYKCHTTTRKKNGVPSITICSPSYDRSKCMSLTLAKEMTQAEATKLLENLSGMKTANLWITKEAAS